MADKKREIQFNTTMGADKRNENLAYLRKGVFDAKTKGLYPAKDLTLTSPSKLPPNSDLIAVIGRNEDPWVFVDASDGLRVYRLFNDNDVNTKSGNGAFVDAIAHGVDGTYWVDNDEVWTIYDSNDNFAKVADFPSNPGRIRIGAFDGLHYWWVGDSIWKQLPGDPPEQAMAQSGFYRPNFVVPYNDSLVIFDQGTTNQYRIWQPITVYFYDKSSQDFFDKRIEIPNATVLAAGVVGSRLMMVYFSPDTSNGHENFGQIIVSAWDGSSFVKLNSIPSFRSPTVPTENNLGMSCSYSNEFMIFSVDDNDRETWNADLAKNFVYKVYADGRIEVVAEPIANGNSNFAKVVRIDKDFLLYGVDSAGGDAPKIYLDGGVRSPYTNYTDFTQTEYITNFYCNPGNRHRLDAFSVTFEKMFRNNTGATSPIINIPSLTFTGILDTSLTINWYPARDNITPENELEYAVYISDMANISNVAEIELNGTLVRDFQTGNTAEITGLNPEQVYWANVVVRDNAGKKSAYTQAQFTMEEAGTVASDWKLGSNVGVITGSSNWSNPTRLLNISDTYSTGVDTAAVTVFGFGHSIPTSSTIKAIEVKVKGFILPNEQHSDSSLVLRAKVFKNATSPMAYPTGGQASFNFGGRTQQNPLTLSSSGLFADTWQESDLANMGVLLDGNASATPNSVYYNAYYVETRIIYKP